MQRNTKSTTTWRDCDQVTRRPLFKCSSWWSYPQISCMSAHIRHSWGIIGLAESPCVWFMSWSLCSPTQESSVSQTSAQVRVWRRDSTRGGWTLSTVSWRGGNTWVDREKADRDIRWATGRRAEQVQPRIPSELHILDKFADSFFTVCLKIPGFARKKTLKSHWKYFFSQKGGWKCGDN